MNAYERAVGEAAMRTYGHVGNILKAVEELAELQQALCKHLALPNDGMTVASVHEEMADVEIMMGRLRMMFDGAEVQDWKDSKLDKMARILGVELGEAEERG